MSEVYIFMVGAVLFVLTTSATFLFGMLRFNEVYEDPQAELETLESVSTSTVDARAPVDA